MSSRDARIRDEAYRLWQQAGAPDGRADEFWAAAEAAEGSSPSPAPGDELPSAGPHSRTELTNEDATPGTGMLPPVGESDDGNVQPSG